LKLDDYFCGNFAEKPINTTTIKTYLRQQQLQFSHIISA